MLDNLKARLTMSSYAQLYLHCVWATWDRLPLITADLEPHIYSAIAAKCKELHCIPLAIGGIADHIHLLVEFPTTLSIAILIKEMKGASSHLATHTIQPDRFFKWQGSYGAFTVSKRLLPQVRAYIRDQAIHHANKSFISEYEHCSD